MNTRWIYFFALGYKIDKIFFTSSVLSSHLFISIIDRENIKLIVSTSRVAFSFETFGCILHCKRILCLHLDAVVCFGVKCKKHRRTAAHFVKMDVCGRALLGCTSRRVAQEDRHRCGRDEEHISNILNLNKIITVAWNDQKRFDALVNTDVAYVQKIMFRFKPGAHDVMLMASQSAYDSCNFAGATAVSASGITINAGGTYYFASSKGTDCASGLKQTYSITPLPSPPPPPNPSPPPPPSPSPPPSTPTCYGCGPRYLGSYAWNEPVYFRSTVQNFQAKCADAQGTERDLNNFYLTATSAFECHAAGQTTCLCPAPVKLPSGNIACNNCYMDGGFVKHSGGFDEPDKWCWADANSGRHTSISGAVCLGNGQTFCECSGGKRRSLLADEKSSLPALPGLDDHGRGF